MNDQLRLQREQLRAANSVHMQTLAMIAKWDIAGTQTGQEFAMDRRERADKAAQSVRLDDCVVAVPQ